MIKKQEKKKIILFEAFAGIGSQHQALKNIGYNVEIAGISDWYVDAIVSYGINHLSLKSKKIDKGEIISYLKDYSFSLDSKKSAKSLNSLSAEKLSILYQVVQKFGDLDINHISGEKLIDKNIDLFTYSFPCQDISQQGKKKGFSRDSNSRSGLLWEVERILKEIYDENPKKLPKTLMMENVKALLNINFQEDLNLWISELEKLGYKSTKPFVINSLDLGEAQRRERVFMISTLGEKEPKEFKLKGNFSEKYIQDIFEEKMEHEKFISNKDIKIIHKDSNIGIKKSFLDGYSSFNAESYVFFKDGKSPTITASGAQSRIKIFHNDEIVYLNGQEHLKLQGFDDKRFYENMVRYGISETRIKFLAGNSINVKVLEEIFKFYL